MSAYYLVDVREIRDRAKMDDYRSRINAVVESFGGRYVVIGGPFEVVEGSYEPVFSGDDRVSEHGGCTSVVPVRRIPRAKGSSAICKRFKCILYGGHCRLMQVRIGLLSVGLFVTADCDLNHIPLRRAGLDCAVVAVEGQEALGGTICV